SSPQTAADVYYKTEGVPVGPPAPPSGATVYARYGSLDNRILVWFVTQQHTYFGGFVLALPIFCVIIELMGLLARDGARAARYDRMARDLRLPDAALEYVPHDHFVHQGGVGQAP